MLCHYSITFWDIMPFAFVRRGAGGRPTAARTARFSLGRGGGRQTYASRDTHALGLISIPKLQHSYVQQDFLNICILFVRYCIILPYMSMRQIYFVELWFQLQCWLDRVGEQSEQWKCGGRTEPKLPKRCIAGSSCKRPLMMDNGLTNGERERE